MMIARAMILAAGRGQRMRPLTDRHPKPLLKVRGKPLMQWHIEALARSNWMEVVVNTAWLGEQISKHFDSWSHPLNPSLESADNTSRQTGRLHIAYSHEGQDFGTALETAGGIVRALPILGEVFWVLAGDIFAPDFAFSRSAVEHFSSSGKLAHLWLVPNPQHNLKGDFGLSADGLALADAEVRYTFSTIGLYRRALFAPPFCDIPAGNPQGAKAPLAPILRAAMRQAQVTAELYTGEWTDVGTPERLAQLNLMPTEPT